MRTQFMLPCFLLGLSVLQVHAQQTFKGGAPDAKLNPSMAGDGNQGSIYSPNLFNGTANVNIPIFSYGDKGISLSYNTAGVKVDELSGEIGLHWNLNAGGSITRMVKDVPDEINTNNTTSYPLGTGDVGNYTIGIKGKWARYFGGASPSGEVDNDGTRYMDDESDDFIFSVGGLSFTFNIGKDRFIFTNPYTNIKIETLVNGTLASQIPLSTNNTNTDLNFRVRDAQGNWYYFEKGDVSRRVYPIPGAPGEFTEIQYTTKWVINKIVQNNGQEINYQYNESTLYSVGADYTDMINTFTAEERSATPSPVENTIRSSDQLTSTKYISSITYPNSSTATFVYASNSGTRCDDPTNGGTNPILREIKITEGTAGTRYVMDQAYSLSPYTGSSIPNEQAYGGSCYDISFITDDYRYHRLILKGIRIKSMDGNTIEPYYTFDYNIAIRLPARFSGAQDYYGYYNGKTVTQNNGKLTIPLHIPKFGSSTTPYGVDRSVDTNYTTAGLLKTITNASGGKTDFTYDAHNLGNVLSNGNITLPSVTTDPYLYGRDANDGVRVKSIKTSDSRYPGIYTQQNYIYTGGQRFLPGGYFDFPLYNGGLSASFNGTFVSPHQFINGANHGYNSVTVETRNNSSQLLSKRVTVFQNISTAPYITSYYKTGSKDYFQLPFTDKQYIREWELGLPLSITEYDQFENKISVTTNTYDYPLDDTSTIGKIENLKILATTDMAGLNTTIVDSESYRPYTGLSLLKKTVIKKYINPTTFITDEVNYTYDKRKNPETIVTINSLGETFVLKNIYNYNVSGTGVPYGTQAGTLYDMTDDGLEFKVGTERWKTSTTNPPLNDKLLDASITCFKYQDHKINTRKLFTLRALSPISFTEYTGVSTIPATTNIFGKIIAAYNTSSPITGFHQASEVLQFDNKGNPIETKISDQSIYKSMIWDPATGDKLAEATCKLNEMAYSGFESTNKGNWIYNQLNVQAPPSGLGNIDGSYVLKANSGAGTFLSVSGLTLNKDYILTFWSKGGIIHITGGGVTGDIPYTLLYGDATNQSSGWRYYQAKFTPTNNNPISFELIATGSPFTNYIDDVRLFPSNSSLQNWSYAPMVGTISSTDAQGRITYYLYDVFGRQTAVKNQDGNVVSKQERHLAQ